MSETSLGTMKITKILRVNDRHKFGDKENKTYDASMAAGMNIPHIHKLEPQSNAVCHILLFLFSAHVSRISHSSESHGNIVCQAPKTGGTLSTRVELRPPTF